MSKRRPKTRPRQRAQQITIDAAELRRREQRGAVVSAAAEFRCGECDARCTETTAGTELGHAYGCPERPAGLPDGGDGA